MHVYTTGYEGTSLDIFLRRLADAGIEAVADVRELPLSRKRGFSKTALSIALAEVGIDYRHIRELGCPKSIRDRYRKDGDWAAYSTAFLQHLAGQVEPVSELSTVAGQLRTALLCFEADFDRCHRTYVARAVASNLDADVAHITGDGGIAADTPVAPSPTALAKEHAR